MFFVLFYIQNSVLRKPAEVLKLKCNCQSAASETNQPTKKSIIQHQQINQPIHQFHTGTESNAVCSFSNKISCNIQELSFIALNLHLCFSSYIFG
jgi:hypothetical protein